MFCTTSETEGEVVHVKLVKAHPVIHSDRSKAVVFCGSLLSVFFGVSVMFHLTCVHISFSSDWVAEWPPLRK